MSVGQKFSTGVTQRLRTAVVLENRGNANPSTSVEAQRGVQRQARSKLIVSEALCSLKASNTLFAISTMAANNTFPFQADFEDGTVAFLEHVPREHCSPTFLGWNDNNGNNHIVVVGTNEADAHLAAIRAESDPNFTPFFTSPSQICLFGGAARDLRSARAEAAAIRALMDGPFTEFAHSTAHHHGCKDSEEVNDDQLMTVSCVWMKVHVKAKLAAMGCDVATWPDLQNAVQSPIACECFFPALFNAVATHAAMLFV